MLALGVILCTLTWKYRHLAKYLIYHGLIVLLIQAFVPQEVDSLTSEICFQTVLLYFCNACGTGTEIIAITTVCFILLMTQQPVLFNLEITVGFVLTNIASSLEVLAVFTLFGTLAVYIEKINAKLVQLLDENIKLLDKMHEGLIVISEKDLCL